MASDNNFTYDRCSSYRRASARDCKRVADLPAASEVSTTRRPTTSHNPQDLLGSQLFNDLLFNRTSVYGKRAALITARPATPTLPTGRHRSVARVTENLENNAKSNFSSLETGHNLHEQTLEKGMLSQLFDSRSTMAPKSPPVSKTRGQRAAKKTPAKKTAPKTAKKRPGTPINDNRSTKVPKTEANSKKKVNGRSSTSRARSITMEPEVIEISSDSEDDENKRNNRNHDYTPPRANIVKEEEPAMLDTVVLDDLPAVATRPTSPPQRPLDTILPKPSWEFPTTLDEPNELAPTASLNDYSSEMQLLHEQLESAKADRSRLEKHISDLNLAKVHSDAAKDAKYNALERNLRTEQEKRQVVTLERDQLRIDLDNAKAITDEITNNLQAEQRLREKEKKEHEELIYDLTPSKSPSIPSNLSHLQAENARLRTEIERYRSGAPLSPTLSCTSPSPTSQEFKITSTSPSQEAIKENNIRKVYTKVKQSYDKLHSVAVRMATSTKGMDLSSFGEFGKHVKELNRVLDEDGAERAGAVDSARVRDDAK